MYSSRDDPPEVGDELRRQGPEPDPHVAPLREPPDAELRRVAHVLELLTVSSLFSMYSFIINKIIINI